jgi:hypothetical protein
MKRVFGTPIVGYLPALMLWLLTAAYLVTGYGYSADSRVMPVLVAWSMLLLLLLDLISRTQTRFGHALTRWLNPAAHAETATPDRGTTKRQFAAVLWLAGFTAALLLIGVLYAVPLYVAASLRLRAGRPYVVCLAGGGAMALLVWVLFVVVLQLNLYPGLLFGGA